MSKNPIIFVFNMRRSVFEQFGLTHFSHISEKFNIKLLPIINNLNDGIENRASQINKKLPFILDFLKQDKAHIIGYSLSGVDCRFALSNLGLDKHCHTLTTISSPHLGSKCATLS
jgi:hypothetical protein